MLSACSWEGIALQREQLKADVYCAATSTVRGLGRVPGDPRAHPLLLWGSLLPGAGTGAGQIHVQTGSGGHPRLVPAQADWDLLEEARRRGDLPRPAESGVLESLVNKSGS